MNRRQFLKGLGAALAAAALPRVRAVGEAPPIEEEHGDRYTLVFCGDATRESYLDGKGYRVADVSVRIDVPGKGWVVIPGWEEQVVWRDEHENIDVPPCGVFTWEVT